MKPQEFQRQHLIRGTSDPNCQEKRVKRLKLIATVILILVAATPIAWALLDLQGLFHLVRSASLAVRLTLISASFLLSMMLTAILMSNVSRHYSRLKSAGKMQQFSQSMDIKAVALGFVIGAAVWFGVGLLTDLSPRLRFFYTLFSLLPIAAMLVTVRKLKKKEEPKEKKKRTLVFRLIQVLLLLALLFFLFDLVGVYLYTPAHVIIQEIFPRYEPYTVSAILLPIAFILWLVERALKAKEDDEEEEAAPKEPPRPPHWLDEFLMQVPEGCSVCGAIGNLADKEASTIDDKSAHLRRIFDENIPTHDQVTGFECFRDLYKKFLLSKEIGNNQMVSESVTDLIVESEAGAGRTTLFMACVFDALFSHGQRALWIVPDEEAVEEVTSLFDRVAKAIGVEGYISCAIVNATEIPNVVGTLGKETEKESNLPVLWVGTLDQVESALYGSHLGKEHPDSLRLLIATMQLMVVDDFMSFQDTEQKHLPFLIDKHRLVVESNSLHSRTLIGMPILADLARDIVGRRLIGEGRFQPNIHTSRLRPRPLPNCWKVRIEASHPDKALEELACLLGGTHPELDIIVYKAAIDETERKKTRADMISKMGPRTGKFEVISRTSPVQQIDKATANAAAIFHQPTLHGNMSIALILGHGDEGTVLFEIISATHAESGLETGAVPVLMGKDAVGMLLEHLISAAQLIPARKPVPEECWNKLIIHRSMLGRVDREIKVDMLLDYDSTDFLREKSLNDVPSDLKNLGSMISIIDPPHHPGKGISTNQIHPVSRLVISEPNTGKFSITDKFLEDGQSDIGKWVGDKLEVMTSLATLRDFILNDSSHRWACRSIEPSDSPDIVALLHAEYYKGNGTQHILPMWCLKFKLEESQTISNLHGDPTTGFFVCSLEPLKENIRVEAKLIKRFTESGILTSGQIIDFGYAATVSAICIGLRTTSSRDLDMIISGGLAGEWDSDSDIHFWPELTAAFHYAMDMMVAGGSSFCRALAFDLKDHPKAPSRAVIFIIEPVLSGRSASNVFVDLFRDNHERARLFEVMQWVIGKISEAPDPDMTMRRFARVAFTERSGTRDCTSAVRLCRDVISRADDSRSIIEDSQLIPKPTDEDVRPPQGGRKPEHSDELPDYPDDAVPLGWKESIERLARSIKTTEDLSISLLLRLQGVTLTAGHFKTDRVAISNRAPYLELELAADTPQDQFIDALSEALSQGASQYAENRGRPAALLLWGIKAEDKTQGRFPRFDDPLFVGLAGGFSIAGLLLTARYKGPPAPTIPVEPTEGLELLEFEPAFSVPDEVTEMSVGSRCPLPAPPLVGDGPEIKWFWRNHEFSIRFGFADRQDAKRYVSLINDNWTRRIARWGRLTSPHNIIYYLLNDPYLDAMHALAKQLREKATGMNRTEFAQYLLAFVQSFEYLSDDTSKASDWPRFPSEHIANEGGDCEDSSALFASLLLAFGYDTSLLLLPQHAAIGVVGDFTGVHYSKDGKKYYYAETATSMGMEIGMEGTLAVDGHVFPFIIRSLPPQAPICVLRADLEYTSGLTVDMSLAVRHPQSTKAKIAVYGHLNDANDSICLGVGEIDIHGGRPELVDMRVEIQRDRLQSGSWEVSVVAWIDDKLAGRWLHVGSFGA